MHGWQTKLSFNQYDSYIISFLYPVEVVGLKRQWDSYRLADMSDMFSVHCGLFFMSKLVFECGSIRFMFAQD